MGRPFGKVDKQDLVGKKIGKLTVVEYAGKRNTGKIKYINIFPDLMAFAAAQIYF